MRRKPGKLMSVALIVVMTAVMAAAPMAVAEEPVRPVHRSGDAMLMDAVFLRPLGLVSLLGGTVLFVVTLPFSLPSGNTEESANRLIAKPAEYTFGRPLGQLE